MSIDHKALLKQAQQSAQAVGQWSDAKRGTISLNVNRVADSSKPQTNALLNKKSR